METHRIPDGEVPSQRCGSLSMQCPLSQRALQLQRPQHQARRILPPVEDPQLPVRTALWRRNDRSRTVCMTTGPHAPLHDGTTLMSPCDASGRFATLPKMRRRPQRTEPPGDVFRCMFTVPALVSPLFRRAKRSAAPPGTSIVEVEGILLARPPSTRAIVFRGHKRLRLGFLNIGSEAADGS